MTDDPGHQAGGSHPAGFGAPTPEVAIGRTTRTAGGPWLAAGRVMRRNLMVSLLTFITFSLPASAEARPRRAPHHRPSRHAKPSRRISPKTSMTAVARAELPAAPSAAPAPARAPA